MMPQQSISISISRLANSIATIACNTKRAMLIAAMTVMTTAAMAQGKLFSIEKDSIPLFCGVAVSVDLVEPATLMLGDKGGLEGAVKVNLHNHYYPIVEIGYGRADYTDEVTEMTYKTSAPYFRIGCDLNLLKNKHTDNRLYAGLRYSFTSFNADISRKTFSDPVWGWDTSFSITDERCSQHWFEVVFGLDTKLFGPLHLGWNVRYKRRLAHSDTSAGEAWYVPGYGENGDTRIGANFNVIIDI